MKRNWRKVMAIMALVVGLFGLGGLTAGLLLWRWQQRSVTVVTPVQVPQPQVVPVATVPRLLDGVLVPTQDANHFVYGVMIDNNKEARPTASLAEASVVYEAMAEGGVPRLLALFPASASLDKIGPVRSARPYFIDWAGEWGAALIHSGGSPEALSRLRTDSSVRNLDEIGPNGKYFFRDLTRATPHNLYTSSNLLGQAARDLAWPSQGAFQSWQFKDPAPLAERAEITPPLQLRFYERVYTVEWRYDRLTNRYGRFQGATSVEDETRHVIGADVIIVQFLPVHVLDAIGRLQMKTTGQGEAKIFQDGKMIPALWQKASGGRTVFTDESGRELKFNRGKIWVEVRPKELPMSF